MVLALGSWITKNAYRDQDNAKRHGSVRLAFITPTLSLTSTLSHKLRLSSR
jgi:hypothetical protein